MHNLSQTDRHTKLLSKTRIAVPAMLFCAVTGALLCFRFELYWFGGLFILIAVGLWLEVLIAKQQRVMWNLYLESLEQIRTAKDKAELEAAMRRYNEISSEVLNDDDSSRF